MDLGLHAVRCQVKFSRCMLLDIHLYVTGYPSFANLSKIFLICNSPLSAQFGLRPHILWLPGTLYGFKQFSAAAAPEHSPGQSEAHTVNENSDSVKTFRDKKHRL